MVVFIFGEMIIGILTPTLFRAMGWNPAGFNCGFFTCMLAWLLWLYLYLY